MFVLWMWIWNAKRTNAQHLGKLEKNCLKKNNFQAVFKFKKENVERVEENKNNKQVFSVKNIEQKKNTLY